MSAKIAVVTGANKGIGYGIVKELCDRGVDVVYLTARDVTRGTEAINKLMEEGVNPVFRQLDTNDEKSIQKFANHLKKKHGGLDILINNAGVFVSNFHKTTYDDAKRVIDTNYKSNLTIQEYLFPILKDNARVINVSSDMGHISHLKNKSWIERLTKEDIKLEDINAFVDWFLESVKNEDIKEEDYKHLDVLAYKVSKIALCALTRVQQSEISRGISVNSIHPGFVKTDMTRNLGFITVAESAVAPVYLALDIDQSVKGKYFWFDKTEVDWTDVTLDFYSEVEDFSSKASAQ